MRSDLQAVTHHMDDAQLDMGLRVDAVYRIREACSGSVIHGHINMLGHYTFTLPEDILKGELRPLNLNVNNEVSP